MFERWRDIILRRRSSQDIWSLVYLVASVMVSVAVVLPISFAVMRLEWVEGLGDTEKALFAVAYIGVIVLLASLIGFAVFYFCVLPIKFRQFKKNYGSIDFVYRSEAVQIYYEEILGGSWLYALGTTWLFVGAAVTFGCVVYFFPVHYEALGVVIRLSTLCMFGYVAITTLFIFLMVRREMQALEWIDDNRHLFPEIRPDPESTLDTVPR